MPITQILLTATTAAGSGSYPVMGSGTYISNIGAAFGGVQGTAYDPGGGVASVLNNVNSWAYYIKDGEFNNNTGFFNGVTRTGEDTYGGFGDQAKAKEYYAIQWVGYIYVQTTGDYNIHLSADDLLYFWIGTNALSGNFNLSNHHHSENNGQSYAGNSVTLTGGLYYPIRMWFQEWSGNEKAQVHIGPVASAALAINQWSITYNSQTEGHNITPTYTITPVANNVDEGSELAFTVGGTNITNGTYYWTVDGNGPFDGENGSFEIANNLGSITVTPTADTTTEGSETFTLSIRSDSTSGTVLQTSESITINDTSQTPTPTYTLTPEADNIDEGSSLTITVGGTNITNGTYYWTIETGAGEFDPNTGEVSVTDNSGTFSVTPTADVTTEGSETFTVALRSGSVSGSILETSESITINDTSLDPTYTLTPEADNIDEGSSLEFTVGGTNIPDGNYSWVIETGAEDFTTTNGSVTVTGNSGTFSVTPTEDTTTEGPGTFTVSLRTGLFEPNLVTSESVTINDTSLDPPEPTYTLTPEADNVDEGSSLEFTVGGTDIPAGNYYWTIETNSSDFGTTSGVFPIGGNSGTFSVTPSADVTTEGSETFTVSVRSGDVEGTVLITSDPITINDTSFPVAPFSLQFVNSENDYLDVAASSNFNLGTTWTIEFWLKANAASETAGGGIWGLVNQVGWSTTNAIVVALSDNKLVFLSVANEANNDVRYVEPTPGEWTHVAISNNAGTQKVFYNGAEQTRVSGNVGTASYTNGTDPVRIGRLGPSNGGTLNGKMALVRISNTAKYATAFTPVTTYGVETDTKLLLDLDTPLIGLSYYELNGVSLVTNGPTVIYISKSAYPNLNNQVQAGNTVVNTFDQTTSVVTGTVFTADPENWGVNVSPGWGLVATVNFTGTRSASVTNSGTALSNDVPQTFIGLAHPYTGGNFGSTYCLDSDPRFAEAATIPIGARIISNIAGFGIRTVTNNLVVSSDRIITYDATGLTGFTSQSDVFNFYW